MALIAKKECTLNYNIKSIWNIIVNNNEYEWRSDITKIKISENGKDWIEYYDLEEKYFTKFILEEKQEYNKYSFKMENKNFTGNWVGEFIETGNKETKCIFIETINMKNKIMKILAKIFWNINKIQEKYKNDLIKKLEEENK
jgi:hypothetical protein